MSISPVLIILSLFAWLVVAPTLANLLTGLIMGKLRNRRSRHQQERMRKHEHLLQEAAKLYTLNRVEMAEAKMQEYAQKAKVHIGYKQYIVETEEVRTEIFHPDACRPNT